MPMGPGKYEPECTEALLKTGGHTVLLIVLGGAKGTGFSMATTDPASIALVPAILRSTADEIEKCSTDA